MGRDTVDDVLGLWTVGINPVNHYGDGVEGSHDLELDRRPM